MEGLGHNLFSVGQFCDSDLEVAFRQYTCFIRNLDSVGLLTGSRGNNLYTLSLKDMMASSHICLFSKALAKSNFQKFLYEVDELRAISGHMLGASKVQIPKNNLDNLHSIIKDGTLEIVDPQELLGLVGLLSIGIGFLRGNIAVVVILVKGHTFPTNVKVRPVDLDFTRAFTELIYANEMALVSTTLFFLFKLGCDPLALESKFTPVEERTGVLETTFVEDVVLTGVFPDEGICSVNLIFLLLFFGVTSISLVPKSLMQGHVCLKMISNS
nr:integrase, catalytic region, zinc finger, CCHC-type, peptidase aspartic, catalytic [Tanacetum cinerariifolium]